MIRNRFSILLVLGVALAGCNLGNAPDGMSGTEAKANFENLPPQEKIKMIASSPMPDSEKKQRYAEIEAKTGVKAADVLGGGFNK